MTYRDIEGHLSAARAVARAKARTAIGRCGLTPGEREDIESELLLALCERLPRFNSQLSSLRTFASCVMEREIASIVRYRLAHRRLHLGRPELVEHDAPESVYGASPSTAQQQNFWLDVDRVLRALPTPLQETVMALRCGSATEASRELGAAKSVVYDRISQIRDAFLSAGIDARYFHRGAEPRRALGRRTPERNF